MATGLTEAGYSGRRFVEELLLRICFFMRGWRVYNDDIEHPTEIAHPLRT